MQYFVYSFQIFLLVWARMAGVVFLAPVFSSSMIPARFKAILSFLITIVIFPWVANLGYELPVYLPDYGLIVVKEIIIGVIFGFFLSVIFAAFQLTTQFFATQIGLGMSKVFDPNTQEQMPVMGIFFQVIAILIFLAINGMHMVLIGVADSYELLPVINLVQHSETLMTMAIKYFSIMFIIALKMAFPIICTSVIIVFCLGLIGKIAPQANILLLGLPLQFGVGLIILLILLPAVITNFEAVISNVVNNVMLMLKKTTAI
ncbi:MAG TPA: flagellar biosynthetic protein FliR [Spirochaetota bacterium]|nr:flagellar biosynthetic protein FliR [Spirochaetota bacterium]